MTADLSALIARLEAAEVGSRELDAAVWLACGFERKIGGPIDAAGNGVWEGPHVSHFLDAALALAERIGWRLYSLDASIIGRHSVMLQSIDDRPGTDPETGAVLIGKAFSCGSGKTPALALCIAILRAKQGEGE